MFKRFKGCEVMEWNGSDRDDMKSQINPKGTM
jgi:hypothetical protein